MDASHHALGESQGAVWSEIADMSADLAAGSPTGAMNEITGRKRHDVVSWTASFPAVQGQVGVLAFLGASPLGLDVIGDAGLYARLHDRLIGGYVQDALRVRGAEGSPDPEAAEGFLGSVRNATRVEAATVGHGRYRVLSGDVTGGELEDQDRTVHLSAFPVQTETGRTGSHGPDVQPLAPPSRRGWIR
jgi:hypothetical protein